jgi:hypothetical protein
MKPEKDIGYHFNVDLSGRDALLGTVGLETVYKKVAVGANWQTPISQNLAGVFVKGNNRLMLHVAFAL